MKGFLDCLVSRAAGRGASLRPRVAHRYGPPQHQLPAADDGYGGGAGRGEDGEALPASDAGGNDRRDVDAAARPLPPGESDWRPEAAETTAVGSRPRLEAAVLARPRLRDDVGPALVAGGAAVDGDGARTTGTTPDGQPSATIERGPPPASMSAPTGPSAPSTSINRLQARLRLDSDQHPVRSSTVLDGSSATVSAGVAPVSASDAPNRGGPPIVSRPAESAEDAFWRFLYGPRAEASTNRNGPNGKDRAPTVGTSSFETPGAGARRVASATSNASATPRTMNVTVGRIDVRNPAGSAPRPAAVPARRPPRLGLADYMRQSAPGSWRR